GRRLGQPGREDALVELAIVRGLDRDEHLVVVKHAELVRQGLEHGRVIADLVEEQGPDDGGAGRGRRTRATRSGGAGVEQRSERDTSGEAQAEAEPTVKKGTTGVVARQYERRVGHSRCEAISGLLTGSSGRVGTRRQCRRGCVTSVRVLLQPQFLL